MDNEFSFGHTEFRVAKRQLKTSVRTQERAGFKKNRPRVRGPGSEVDETAPENAEHRPPQRVRGRVREGE